MSVCSIVVPCVVTSTVEDLCGGTRDATPYQRLAELPGFVGLETAVSQKADKREALAKMERLSVDWLPVVNPRNEFVGVVDRSRLTASLVLDVATSLKESKN